MAQDTRFIGLTDYWNSRTSHVILEGGYLTDGFTLSATSFELAVKKSDLFIEEKRGVDPVKTKTEVLIPLAFIE